MDRQRRIRASLLSLVMIMLAACAAPAAESRPVTGVPLAVTTGQLPTYVPITPTPAPTATPVPLGPPVPLADAPASFEYALPPVIQHVTETQATLFFELLSSVEGIVVITPVESNGNDSLAIPFAADQPRQQLTVSHLRPGTTYQVLIGVDEGDGLWRQVMYGGELWGPLYMRTRSPDRSVRFGVFGDSGFGSPATYNLMARLAQEDIDFVVHTGDLVYEMIRHHDPFDAYRQKWYLPLKPLLSRMPVYPVVGNHDVEPGAVWESQPFYYHTFPSFADPLFVASDYEGKNQWYAFAVNEVQFLMLDSQTFLGEAGHEAQTAWLGDRLNDERFRQNVVVFHIAPYTSSRHQYQGRLPQTYWVPLFEAANVRLVFSGHAHNYERLTNNGIVYIVSGGGSETLYQQEAELPFSDRFAAMTHYVLVDIGQEAIHLLAINDEGQVLDEAWITLE